MKRMILTIAAGLAATTSWAAEQVITVEVSGLTCPSCPYIAADAIKAVESAEILNVDFNSGDESARYTVRFDDAVTTAQAVATASDSYGYSGAIVTDDNS